MNSTVEVGATREKIPTDLQTSPLIGNFLLYIFVSVGETKLQRFFLNSPLF